jgi:monofunctional glycosyltransferase
MPLSADPVVVALVTLMILIVWGTWGHASTVRAIIVLKTAAPERSALMSQRCAEATAKGKSSQLKYYWIPYRSISTNLVRAVIITEDPDFFLHHGFVWRRIYGAFKLNLKERRIVRGASSISQQTAKNLFLTPARTYRRKLREALLTIEMELILGKRRILEIYLNVIEWGEGIYGVKAAAQHYFGISAETLTDRQAAFLATTIASPRRGITFSTMPGGFKAYNEKIVRAMQSVKLPLEEK